MIRKFSIRLLAVVLMIAGVTPIAARISPAQSAGRAALILARSVSGGPSSLEQTDLEALGFTVTSVDDATWAGLSAAGFAAYDVVVVGDPTCGTVDQVVSTNATALGDAVMGRAGGRTKAGNRVLIGTDPVYHQGSGGSKLIAAGLAYAAAQTGATNLYLDTTCYDYDYDSNGKPDVVDLVLPKLTTDATPGWTENQGPPCGGAVSLISNAAQFNTLKTSDIQAWGCSVHMTFPTFPSDFLPLAVATDTASAPTCGNDVDTGAAKCGEAYVLIAGTGITATSPNLALAPLTEGGLVVGTSSSVTATVTNVDHTPRPGTTVTFVVTGANAGAAGTCAPASCITDAAGHVVFTYTGASKGTDTIIASVVIDGSTQSATASKSWGEEGPPPTNAAPVFDSPPTPTSTINTLIGTAVTFDIKAHDPDGDLISLGLTGPNGTVTGTSGAGATKTITVSFTPPSAGDFTIHAVASDGLLSTGKDVIVRADRRPTKLVANPLVANIVGTPLLPLAPGATLTSLGAPVAGRTVTFYVYDYMEACTAVTDAQGLAQCAPGASTVSGVLGLGYTAKFNGDATYLPSKGSFGPVIRVAGIGLP